MTTLQVEIGDRSWAFDGDRAITVGRDPQADIPLTGNTVSRRHAELRPGGGGWTLVDVGSSAGTYVGGNRVDELRLTGRGSVRIGGAEGEELRYVVADARPAAEGAVLPAAGLGPTVVPGGVVPGGYLPGPALLVRAGATSRRFVPGAAVRIGRDPANEIVIDDSSVSRLHAVVESRPDGWWFVDRSTAGTFHDEDRIRVKLVDEPTKVMLGHPTAGVEVEIVPIVEARQAQKAIAGRKRRRSALVVGGIAAAVLLAGGGVAAVALLGDDDSSGGDDPAADAGLTTAELDRAKLASVLILSVDETDTVLGNGSGSIISEDGLILTNAHVADPDAPGQYPPGEQPAGYLIALTSEDDDLPAAPSYTAETIVSDGVLDLAVMQITGDAAGNPIDPADLDLPEPLPLGDSDTLRTGDEITALGFPSVAHVATDEEFERRALTVTRGVVSTFLREEPVDETRAWIDSDIRIGSGNSGGASINEDGELVGINTAVVTEATTAETGDGGNFTAGSARIRPVGLAEEIIAIAQGGGDPGYVSPYLQEAPPPEDVTGASLLSGGWSVDGGATCATTSTVDSVQILAGAIIPGTVYAEYVVSGVPDGMPFEVQFWTLDGTTQLGAVEGTWEQGMDEVCVAIQVDVPEPIEGLNAALFLSGSGVDNPVRFQ